MIKRNHIAVTDPQAAGIEFELWLFLGGYSDTNLTGNSQYVIQFFHFRHIVQNGYGIAPSIVHKVGYILYVQLLFITVAYNIKVFVYDLLFVKRINKIYIKS